MTRLEQVTGWIQAGERLYLDGEPCPAEVPLMEVKSYFIRLAWICAYERDNPRPRCHRRARIRPIPVPAPALRPVSILLLDPWA